MTGNLARSQKTVAASRDRDNSAAARGSESGGARQADQAFTPTAGLLRKLQDDLPAPHFTLNWLLSKLGEQSFGLIILILAILAIAPPVAIPGGLLLLVPAAQMIAGRSAVKFPRWMEVRPLPSRPLRAVLKGAIPCLKLAERLIHRRTPTLGMTAKRLLGLVVLLLAVRLVTHPLPLSNILPAILLALIALAYLEEDGLLLSIGLVAALILLAADTAILWKLVQQVRSTDFHSSMTSTFISEFPI
jgi:hypothetical protein